jgi:DNA-3-methyladenine glycosylase II
MDALKVLAKSDPILGEIIGQIPLPTFISTNNIFHDLMSCILEQQIHYRSTKKIFHKMLVQSNLKELHFSNFSILEENALGKIKLSESKYETLERVLDFWQKNRTGRSDEELISQLSAIKGIGKWTMDMICLYTLQMPNVFPSDDYHLKQIMVEAYGLNPKAKLQSQMKAISDKWGPYKSLAVLYLLDWKT